MADETQARSRFSPFHLFGNGAPGQKKIVKPPLEIKDNKREVVETIVFVVILVLLLKSFVAEAFVIPTGSMAETLWGYQKLVKCPDCGYTFPLSCSEEVENKPATPVLKCICPNCRYAIDFTRDKDPGCNTGDRVLVIKFPYDSPLPGMELKPLDVVVFKFPEDPQRNFVPLNYIKRAIGLPGQTIGIRYGDIYYAEDIAYDSADEGQDLPVRRQFHKNNPEAVRLLESGDKRFRILRKPPDKILAMRREVYDNQFQSVSQHRRWNPEDESAWVVDDPEHSRIFTFRGDKTEKFQWLRYSHLVRSSGSASLITDFMGYNTAKWDQNGPNWVGDLILECEVKVGAIENDSEFRLELSKGVDRFQARFRLHDGTCHLFRISKEGETELASKPIAMKASGTYALRFANVDQRLTLWVDGELPFGDGIPYPPPSSPGPTVENDLKQPVSIGIKYGKVSFNKLNIWRDTYYTNPAFYSNIKDEVWTDPERINQVMEGLGKQEGLTMYVQPGHVLCLGDNSPQSSDSRTWGPQGFGGAPRDSMGGLVPKTLLLGRAVLIYYPVSRAGPIK